MRLEYLLLSGISFSGLYLKDKKLPGFFLFLYRRGFRLFLRFPDFRGFRLYRSFVQKISKRVIRARDKGCKNGSTARHVSKIIKDNLIVGLVAVLN